MPTVEVVDGWGRKAFEIEEVENRDVGGLGRILKYS